MLSLNDFIRLFYRTFSPGRILRETYWAFRSLLDADHKSHEQVAVLEKLYHESKHADFCAVIQSYEEVAQAIPQMIRSLETSSAATPESDSIASTWFGISAAWSVA